MKGIWALKASSLLIITCFVYSWWQAAPGIDDAWLGEHAYWLAQKGFVKSELMHGITGQENRHIVHHKFFTIIGALFIKLFGFSSAVLKSISLISLIAFLVVFLRHISKNIGILYAHLGFFLVLVNSLVFEFGFMYRPEILVMALGFGSYLLLNFSMRSTASSKHVLIAGFLAGLAASTHLNGLIYIGAGAGILLWFKSYKRIPGFLLTSILGFSVYFFDFTKEFNYNYWLYQINDSPAIYQDTSMPSILHLLKKILDEQMRFFHSPKEVFFSTLILLSIILNRKEMMKHRILMLYTGLLILGLSILSVNKTSKYLLLYLPFLLLLFIHSFHDIFQGLVTINPNKLKRRAIILAIVIYVFSNFYYDFQIAQNKFNPQVYRNLSLKYIKENTLQVNILAPMTYIFNEIKYFNRIQSDLSYADLQQNSKAHKKINFLSYANNLNMDYLFISDEYAERFGIKNSSSDQLGQYKYQIVGVEGGITILKKMK